MASQPFPSGSPAPIPPGLEPPVVQEPLYYRSQYAASYGTSGFRARDLLDLLLRGKWVILGTILAFVIPAAVYSFITPNLYGADVLLLIHKVNDEAASVLPTGSSSPLLKEQRNLSNELLVLQESEALADSAAARLMAYDTVPGTTLPLTILETPEGGTLTRDIVADRLQDRFIVAALEGGETDGITVEAFSTIPEEAELIANVYAQEFVNYTRNSSRAGASASRRFLEEQVAAQSQALEGLDGQVRDFMIREGAIALDEETSNVISQVASLEAQRDEVEVSIQLKQATIDALEREIAQLEPRLVDFIASGVSRELESAQGRIAELEGRIEQIYLRNPELRDQTPPPEQIADLQRQRDGLQTRVRELSQRYIEETVPSAGTEGGTGLDRVSMLRSQLVDERIALSGLQAQRVVLTERLAEYQGDMRAIPRQSVDLAQLQRQRLSAETLYGGLVDKLQEARVTEQSELGYAEVIRRAEAPPYPDSPNRVVNILLALLLGLGFGGAFAIAKTRLDHRIYRPEDLRERGYPVIGTIPDMTPLIKRDFDGAETVTVGDMALDTHVVTLLNPLSAASETYRALRTSIQFSRPDVVVETILVTSANPAEGKSVTASNLAVVMAQAGRRVLLVDADLRKPSVHRKLGLAREPGLVQQLFKAEAFEPQAYATAIDDLYVLPAGAQAPNPSELIGSKAMRDLIARFRQDFDVIIFDAPPVLVATDAVLLSTQCDATLVVVNAGVTQDYHLESTYESLGNVGAQVVGTVLNGFDLSKAYGYKYKYAQRYGDAYHYGQGSPYYGETPSAPEKSS